MGLRYLNLFFRQDGKVFLNGKKASDEFILESFVVGKANELELIGYFKYNWMPYRIVNPAKLALIKPEYIVTGTYRKWPRFWEKTTERAVPSYQYFELIKPKLLTYITPNWFIEDFPEEEEDD